MPAKSQPPGSGVSRRDFLRVGGLSVVGLSMAERQALAESEVRSPRPSCIFLLMAGGASQLETFDPKPDAPPHIRGPMRAISTAVPGLAFADGLPKLAERAEQFAVVRSLCHDAAPIHETGLQLLHTGTLGKRGVQFPSFGSIIARELGPRDDAPPYVVLPKLLDTGSAMYRGQTAGVLGREFDPVTKQDTPRMPACDVEAEPESIRRRYGRHRFGTLCLQARQLVEAGVRCVVVNLFDRLADNLTWDCHGKTAETPGTLFDYRDVLCPQFDQAASALLDDLADRGMLDDTLVVASGEFGRTPRINRDGGRDHWPGVWSAMLAGGGIPGGAVVGGSDATAAAPKDRPVAPHELFGTILHSVGVTAYTLPSTDAALDGAAASHPTKDAALDGASSSHPTKDAALDGAAASYASMNAVHPTPATVTGIDELLPSAALLES
jgi:hypothetical protein